MTRCLFRAAALAAVFATSLFANVVYAQQGDEGKRLHAFFAEEWERGLRENPESASFEGDKRFNDRWSDNSLEAIAASEAADREALARLKRFDRSKLSPADQLNYDTFLWLQEKSVQRQAFREYLQPMGHQGGYRPPTALSKDWPSTRSAITATGWRGCAPSPRPSTRPLR